MAVLKIYITGRIYGPWVPEICKKLHKVRFQDFLVQNTVYTCAVPSFYSSICLQQLVQHYYCYTVIQKSAKIYCHCYYWYFAATFKQFDLCSTGAHFQFVYITGSATGLKNEYDTAVPIAGVNCKFLSRVAPLLYYYSTLVTRLEVYLFPRLPIYCLVRLTNVVLI